MISKLSKTCAVWITSACNRDDIKVSVMAFGLELMFSSILGVAAMFVVSLIFRHPAAWILYLLGFAPLRTSAGGFHAPSHISCLCISTAMFLIGIIISYYICWSSIVYLIISLFSFILVINLSPVEAVNKKLTPENAQRNRTFSIIITVISVLLACIFCMMNIVEAGINMLYSGLAFATVLLIIAKIKLSGRRTTI